MKGIRLTQEEALNKAKTACEKSNLEFLGFNSATGKYENNKTKVLIKCKTCGHKDEYCFDKLTGCKRKCKICNKHYQCNKNEIIEKIVNRCNELDYEFVGFVADVSDKVPKKEKLILRCKKCNLVWNTTTINNLLRKDRKSHKCGRKNPETMPSIRRSNKNDIEKILEKKLEGSKLNILKIDDNMSHVLLRCLECGSEKTYSIIGLRYKKNVPLCKNCQFNGKLSDSNARKIINDKCKSLDYEFIGFANNDNRYDGKDTKLILKCNKCGYIWKTTSFYNFTHMIIKCRGCTNTWKMEQEVKYYLSEAGIRFETQKKFDWLKYKSQLSLDFFIPEFNISIECQGRQHIQPVDKFGGKEGFELTKKRDVAKLKQCTEKGIKIIYYSSSKFYKNEDNVAKNKEELLQMIKKYKQHG